ncbi:Carbamoyl-phosphate synthase small chain [termite gut metagenome]|uniref:Carbamoyl-phosphate synthase small chain n=1 Tax=termite gut metagenome TaxID=433724 RepID=A0A5J4R8P0_9ZZZZ
MMKINILLCDSFPGLLPPDIPSYPSMFQRLFNSIETGIRYEIFDVRQNIYPETLSDKELYLIPGSTASAYDDIPWINKLQEFIRTLHGKKMKTIGICFGHQIIAQALGGRVMRAPQGWGTGIRSSAVVAPEAERYFPQKEMYLHYNHHDQVVELPPRAIRFATGDFCINEGFFVGDHILTFQGHPEYTREYNKYLLLHHAPDEPEEIKTKALKSLSNEADNLAAANFILDMIREKS